MRVSAYDYFWPFCDDLSLLHSLFRVPPLSAQYGSRHVGFLYPSYSYKSKDGKAFIEIELPGVEKDDIHVETRGHTLTVKAKRFDHGTTDKGKEKARATYSFKARLSDRVNMDEIRADYPGLGVLRIFVPYKAKEAEKVRKVPVHS
ncbi:18 kDa antigen 2 [Gracilariopsis chorda]|uniref:18 kDa antigen 2 n=1 Tax=Gracilariopsis chorda TaxID=448386 RepID=A0A2V3J330_9FLOR|nr:18 kDa antigen 2 [Gracilariopsis chorda]|eukprot:PXF48856.1 18 kDa antigen 2 [Gracilariopsis chorda]